MTKGLLEKEAKCLNFSHLGHLMQYKNLLVYQAGHLLVKFRQVAIDTFEDCKTRYVFLQVS